MGVRGRGKSLTQALANIPQVHVAYVGDVDSRGVEPALQLIEKVGHKRPPVVADIRRRLDDKSVDAIVMGTPLHWHAYVKIREGRLMAEAASGYKRIVQAGRQFPSLPVTQRFHDYVQSGKLGRVLMAKVWNVQLRSNIGRLKEEPIPAGLDYDIWTGPPPKLPFNRDHFDSTVNWHWHGYRAPGAKRGPSEDHLRDGPENVLQ